MHFCLFENLCEQGIVPKEPTYRIVTVPESELISLSKVQLHLKQYAALLSQAQHASLSYFSNCLGLISFFLLL